MNEEMNNEMDLLLRRLSRRHDGSMASIAGEHLDADELSSYAENALPAAARARYTEHLAECGNCRELVVQLSGSAGVIAAAEQGVKSPAPSGWRNFLASLFSPMVLRYAIPALGLIVVAAIGFFVMNRESGFMASRQNSPVAAPQTEASPQTLADSAERQVFSYNSNTAPSNPATKTSQPQRESADRPPVPNAAPVISVDAEVKKADTAAAPPGAQTGAAAVAAQQEPKPTPAQSGDFQVAVETQKAEVRSTEAAKVAKEKGYDQSKRQDRAGDEAADRRSGPARNEAPSPAGGSTARARAPITQMQVDGVEKDKSDADVRSVAGRRFRRESDRWIDTAYNSGMSTVNLTRGSEQYRALVADEPSIKTIADQLDGEVIVVWKRRAYRIR